MSHNQFILIIIIAWACGAITGILFRYLKLRKLAFLKIVIYLFFSLLVTLATTSFIQAQCILAGCGTVIGEETGGMSVHYGDVISFKLPNSGLAVNVSHKRFWLPGADENDIHGVIPDIICPQDEALDTALKSIDVK